MVLEDLENDHQQSKARLLPPAMSLMLHCVLAAILWLLVVQSKPRVSIRLTASLSAPSSTVSLKLPQAIQPVDPVVVDGDEPARSTDSTISDLLLEALADNVTEIADEADLQEEPEDNPESTPIVNFFGAEAIGNKIVFVVDISLSMDARNMERYQRAKNELLRSVSNLTSEQSYVVILFSWRTKTMRYDRPPAWIKAEKNHVLELTRWLNNTTLSSGTDPRDALSLAKAMQPDTIFLLSDGQFNHPNAPSHETGWLLPNGERSQLSVSDGIATYMSSIPIHSISFENPFTKDSMEQIAKQSGGNFRYVKTKSHLPIDSRRFLDAVNLIEDTYRKASERASELQRRMSFAREFIADGEFAFAEYIARPIRNADPANINNPILRKILLNILDEELGDTRLEDLPMTSAVEQWVLDHEPF
ncbi:MAG: vWA domain-containing protein [Rubripirellula sp.]